MLDRPLKRNVEQNNHSNNTLQCMIPGMPFLSYNATT